MPVSKRHVAFVSLLLVGGTTHLARADILPPNACTVPGQPCTYDGGGFVGICTPSTCTRRGPILDAALDGDAGDGGTVIGDIKYPCNLCLRALDGGDAEAGGDADADAGGSGGGAGTGGAGGAGTDGAGGAGTGGAGGAGTGGAGGAGTGGAGGAGTGGSGDAGAGAGGASGTSGTGGTAGSAGTGGGTDASAGAGGASGATGTGGTAGSAGADTDSPDSGCSCILDPDRSQTSLPLSGALGLASVGGFFWLRRRSARTSKKREGSR